MDASVRRHNAISRRASSQPAPATGGYAGPPGQIIRCGWCPGFGAGL